MPMPMVALPGVHLMFDTCFFCTLSGPRSFETMSASIARPLNFLRKPAFSPLMSSAKRPPVYVRCSAILVCSVPSLHPYRRPGMESIGGHNADLPTTGHSSRPAFLVVTEDPLDVSEVTLRLAVGSVRA